MEKNPEYIVISSRESDTMIIEIKQLIDQLDLTPGRVIGEEYKIVKTLG